MRFLPVFAVLAAAVSFEAPAAHPFSAGSTADREARELLAKMTLREKIGQIAQVDSAALKSPRDVTKYQLGSVLSGGNSNPPDGNSAIAWAEFIATFKRAAMETRLRIPLLYGIDAVHGHNNVLGAVIFPHNIGLGATRDPRLVEKAARVTAAEMLATGANWDFAPCIAVVRDERWGRTYESFGESPELVAGMGASAVRGLQGGRLGPKSVLACAKHFVGDGGTFGGKDQGDTRVGEAELRAVHLRPYIDSIEAGVGSIMVSFNSWNGEKLHGHRWLLTEVLKGELGFEGFLVSDWAAIDQLPGDYRSDIERSINAGLDMVMIPAGPGANNNYVEFIDLLSGLVARGRVSMERIDDAVLRILRVKIAMGLGDRPVMPTPAELAAVGSAKHRAIARECVRKSLVLLKNENAVLPLKKRGLKLVVAGRLANDLGSQCGGWTIDWQGARGAVTRGTTILDGIRQVAGEGTTIFYSPFAKALPEADVAVVVVGETPYAEFFGDRKDLQLDRQDRIVIERCRKAGLPVVLVVVSGRPLILDSALEDCAAVVAAWLPGTEGGGVADVLFGDAPATGRLPVTWPRTMAQIPINDGDVHYEPAFPFGFGLSYR